MTNRFLKLGFILLVLMNLSLLFFLCPSKEKNREFRQERGPRGGSPVERISNELGFSQEQKEKLDVLFASHKDAMDEIFSKQRIAKDALFNLIINDTSSNEAAVLKDIAAIEIAKDQQTLKHIREIKSLCTETQLENFPRIIKKILHKRKGKRRGPPPRR